MALTIDEQIDLYTNLTKDNSSANRSFGATLINEHTKRIINGRHWNFTEALDETQTTVGGQQFYPLPSDYHKLIMSPYITIGDIRYPMQLVNDRGVWDKLNRTSYTSDIPMHYYIFNGEIGIYPIPSSDGNTISLPYRKIQQTLTSGSGDTSLLPDGYSMLPVYYAANDYYIGREEQGEADRYLQMAQQMESALNSDLTSKTSNIAIQDEDEYYTPNPNNYPRSIG